ncbi:hypothetical protein UFOVP148_2 [uncultured Caudovirales phage]|uniref:Uncharacterized protein n=1 Tax=uncultured Caudovirales phage TaxID=2100421 RepID=A0A6J7W4W6_9CAUD|nr:hypothetical protein UFOVP148_2 [uncultured Caudovirales phage]
MDAKTNQGIQPPEKSSTTRSSVITFSVTFCGRGIRNLPGSLCYKTDSLAELDRCSKDIFYGSVA